MLKNGPFSIAVIYFDCVILSCQQRYPSIAISTYSIPANVIAISSKGAPASRDSRASFLTLESTSLQQNSSLETNNFFRQN